MQAIIAPMDTDDTDLTLPAAAAELGIAHVTLYRLVKAGRIPSRRIGPMYVIRRADLDAFKTLKREPGRPRKDK